MTELHPRLAADTRPLLETDFCHIRWMNDRRYPWLVLVPRRDNLREWHHLPEAEQRQLLALVNGAARALEITCAPDKLNIGALGNLVPQLHIHVIARFRTDPAWPGPVWGQGVAEPWPEADEPPWLEPVRHTLAAG